MTNWVRMRCCVLAVFLATLGILPALAQAVEDFKVYTEHPRLLLNQKRLRLLKRERERQSLRWMQIETLMKGRAQMPEPAFFGALLGQITGDPEHCKSAAEAAARPATDLRQVALTLDWCEASLTDSQKNTLKARLDRSLKDPITTIASARDRAFAALATGDPAVLQQLITVWWRKTTAPALKSGGRRLEHADLYPFMELAHAIRDNFQIDLRDEILPVFRDLALTRVLSYYPAAYPSPENDFHIPWFSGKGEPDLRLAALTRAGEFALVAYESNAQEMQFLQGWLLHDRFALKGAFGAPYEFLWANPYQPGLPFEKLPMFYLDDRSGLLLVRSSWEEDATWLGVSAGGSIQMFRDGQIRAVPLKDPVEIGPAMIMPGSPTEREFRVSPTVPDNWYLLGLKPGTTFDIETDDEDMFDGKSGPTGILPLKFTRKANQAVYIHEPRGRH